jgi:ATP-dependent helicase/nuclease subunit A
MVQLTENQQAALVRDRDIAVTAGAGTGKTLILVERYIDILLKEEIDIREILAITFTNKAASEMLSRVALKIEISLTEPQDSKHYKKLLKIRNHLSSAYISTIHAFCSRLLREYPMETVGLDPGFNTLNTIQSDFLIEECINDAISNIDTNDQEWLDLFRIFNPHSIKEMIRVALESRFEMKSVIKRFSEANTTTLLENLKEDFFKRVTTIFSQNQLDQIQKNVFELLNHDDSGGESPDIKENVLIGLENFAESGKSDTIDFWIYLFSIARLLTTSDGRAYSNLAQLGGQQIWSTAQKETLLNLSSLLSPISIWQNENFSSCPGKTEETILKNLRKFYDLYQKVENRYTDVKLQQNSIDFDDQQLMAYLLLSNHEDIRQQVADRYKYIMVDEFQDTNLLQWKIIELISREKNNNVFIVGDPKQSIYGFRNADVRVFNSVKQEMVENSSDSDLLLYESFRFKKAVSDFVNTVFQKVLNVSQDNPWEVEYDRIESKRTDSENGKIELSLLNKLKDDNVQANFIASHIINLLAEGHYRAGQLSIMLRTRTHLSEIENTLREYGIPYQTIGGIGFYQGQEIYDTYHLLKFLINPNDDLSLIGLLRSPFANISDEGLFFLSIKERETSYWQKLHHLDDIDHIPKSDYDKLKMFFHNATNWISRRDRIGYFELLSQIFNESFYRAITVSDFKGDQVIANIDKIQNIVLDYERGRFTSVVDFAESLNRLMNTYQKEGEALLEFEEDNSVKIMTIHQAKGLEFPVVYLPYLNQRLSSRGSSQVYFDDDWGVVSQINDRFLKSKKPIQNSYYLYDLMKHKNKLKELAELKRLFYVGCTRAQDHLILCAELNKNKIPSDTPLSWLMNSLDLSTEEISEKRLDISSNLSIHIHTTYKRPDSIQEKERKKTIETLDRLANIIPSNAHEVEEPAFLKKTTDMPKGEMFSATQLMTFMEDKEEYHKRYHLGFFEDDYDELGMIKSNEVDGLLRGRLLHRLMEDYPQIHIESLLDEIDLIDEQLREKLTEEVSKLRNQIDKSTKIKPALTARRFRNEVSVFRKLGTDYITGKLDRIYKNSEDQWIVLDYKTNSISSSQLSATINLYQVQIETYALLIAGAFPNQKNYEVCLYFLIPDELYSEIFDTDRLQLLEKKYEKVIEKIKQYYPYTDKSVL